MTISANPTLREIQTEFGGSSPPTNLRSYYRGGSYVDSGASSSISTSASSLTIRQFASASYTLSASSGSSQAISVYGGGGYTRTDTDLYNGVNTITTASNYYYPGMNPASGTGSFTGTNTVYAGRTILGIFDWETIRVQNGATGSYDIIVGSWLVISGNQTGSWWNSVTANGVTKNRTAAAVTTGTYNSGYNVTYWQWAAGSVFSFPSSGTFTISFT